MKKKHTPTDLDGLIALKGITYASLCEALHVTRPTLRKYINDPMSMSGHMRVAFSKHISLPLYQFDALCRGELFFGFRANSGIEEIHQRELL